MIPTPINTLLCTWFGIGHWRGATGTWASIATLPLCVLLFSIGGQIALLLTGLALMVVAVPLSTQYAARLQQEDPKQIVLDEVVGQMLTLCVVPFSWYNYGLGLVLFRLFDIFKPWPVSYIDKHWPRGYGIVGDDVAAAGYAAACLWVLERYIS